MITEVQAAILKECIGGQDWARLNVWGHQSDDIDALVKLHLLKETVEARLTTTEKGEDALSGYLLAHTPPTAFEEEAS